MAERCEKCFQPMDFLHVCSSHKDDAAAEISELTGGANRVRWLAAAPLSGIALDLFVPLPSSLIHSLALALLGSGLVSIVWLMARKDSKKSAKFHLLNLKNYIFSPLIYRKYNVSNKNSILTPWLLALVFSIVFQVLLFTSGNSQFLANQISNQIEKGSGADLEVVCPNFQAYFYNSQLECRVKTGILGITVPARAKLSIIIGTPNIKVSLL